MPSSPHTSKRRLIDQLVSEFRLSGNQDNAFDNLAAERLGVNRTDLHCLNAIENSGGLTAGQLATAAGLTSGAVTGVIDRLEKVGFARRVSDPNDRRRVKVEVTPEFYAQADRIWGPVKADWESKIAARFTMAELELIIEFLQLSTNIGKRQLDRLADLNVAPSPATPAPRR
jgi:DNA-binding MarR family transcriptional regulator